MSCLAVKVVQLNYIGIQDSNRAKSSFWDNTNDESCRSIALGFDYNLRYQILKLN